MKNIHENYDPEVGYIEPIVENQVEEEEEDLNAPYYYIKLDVKGTYVEFPKELKSEDFNNLGRTLEDFKNNKWVIISHEQYQFHLDNPQASVKEVLLMKLDEVEVPEEHKPTLEQVKQSKLSGLKVYDNSDEVNSFLVNNSIKAWLTPDERSNYRTSIEAAKLLQKEDLSLHVGDMFVTIPTSQAEVILAHIQLYADECYMVTKRHEAAISELTTIEEVEEYDFTQGYPTKLNFNL